MAGRGKGNKAGKAGKLEYWMAEGLGGWTAGGLEVCRAGKLEGWRVGWLEGWKGGRLEGWTAGNLAGWRAARLEGWTAGRLDNSKVGILVELLAISGSSKTGFLVGPYKTKTFVLRAAGLLEGCQAGGRKAKGLKAGMLECWNAGMLEC